VSKDSGFWVAQRFSAAISPLLDGLQPSGFLNFFVRRKVLPTCPSLCRNVGLSPNLTLTGSCDVDNIHQL
jgi:hypothetical protein